MTQYELTTRTSWRVGVAQTFAAVQADRGQLPTFPSIDTLLLSILCSNLSRLVMRNIKLNFYAEIPVVGLAVEGEIRVADFRQVARLFVINSTR